MARYRVSAVIELFVEQEIEANSPAHAKQIFTSIQFSESSHRRELQDIKIRDVKEID